MPPHCTLKKDSDDTFYQNDTFYVIFQRDNYGQETVRCFINKTKHPKPTTYSVSNIYFMSLSQKPKIVINLSDLFLKIFLGTKTHAIDRAYFVLFVLG